MFFKKERNYIIQNDKTKDGNLLARALAEEETAGMFREDIVWERELALASKDLQRCHRGADRVEKGEHRPRGRNTQDVV